MKAVKKYIKFCLSFKGRLNRKAFALSNIALFLVFFLMGIALEWVEPSLQAMEAAVDRPPDLMPPKKGAAALEKPLAEPAFSGPPDNSSAAEGLLSLALLALFGLLLIIGGVIAFFSICALSVRRLHDLNFSGWWFLLIMGISSFLSWPQQAKYVENPDYDGYLLLDMFNPWEGYFPPMMFIFNVAAVALFYLVRGTKGENKYGSDPLSSP